MVADQEFRQGAGKIVNATLRIQEEKDMRTIARVELQKQMSKANVGQMLAAVMMGALPAIGLLNFQRLKLDALQWIGFCILTLLAALFLVNVALYRYYLHGLSGEISREED
ncbi:Uncharacterised protein [Candidatus Gugararchaeum adminiculabundum]|nr:Uncharacterised protein [Candidatus Gugararchaeum adminiculabundum]